MTISTRDVGVEVARPDAPEPDGAAAPGITERAAGVLRHWLTNAAPGETRSFGLWPLGGIALFFAVVSFSQSPGLIEYDTKFQLIVSPISFFASHLHLWNPTLYGGAVPQDTGFLWPMGVYFSVTHVLHVPVWVAERVWLASILTVACWGTIRLAEVLGIGNRWTRVVAGFVYCSAPIFVTYVTTSGDLLAAAFLPWMLRPLVIGSRQGSTRRAAARSGVAVALMGGVNAVVTFATLPVGVIWLLTRQGGPRRRSLAAWWVVAVAMACFWWLVTLEYMAHFGYNYLPYTETSVTTTSTTSLFEAIRGASFWTNYFNLGGPLLRGAWELVASPLVILGSVAVVGTGLAGLCRRIPERLFLVACLALGVVLIAAGFSGPVGGLFSSEVQHLLQGPLAALRNVSKFAPIVALPLALGLAGALVALTGSARRGAGRVWDQRHVRLGLTSLVVLTVVVAATPFWRGELYRSGGFASIPGYWQQAGTYLNEHQGHGNALLVPGSSFGYYTWGDPVDEPLQVTATGSLMWRNIIPLGSNGNTQLTDAVEQALDIGVSPPGLGQFLAREGIDYVVERNDLNLALSGAPAPAQVHQVLAETPGLTEVASFGAYLPSSQVEHGKLPVYDSPSDVHLRPVEIFRVDSYVSPVVSYPAADPLVVSGDVGSLVELAGAGLAANRVAVLSGDSAAPDVADTAGATWADTDGNQRRATDFGGIRYNQSYLLGAHQQLPGQPADVPDSYDVVTGAQHETVEVPVGAESVAASSFGPTQLYESPDYGPAAAFDDDPSTFWSASLADDSVGQWVSISFDKPMAMSSITLTPVANSPEQPTITKVMLTTDAGSVVQNLLPGATSYRLEVVHGDSRHLRVTIEAVQPARVPAAGGIALSAGIASIKIPGVSFAPRMLLPADEARTFSGPTSRGTVITFNRPIANANLSLGVTSTDDPDMRREFSVPKSESVLATGEAVAEPGPVLEQMIHFFSPVPNGSVVVTASSTLGGLPKFAPQNLVEHSDEPWIASIGDQSPSVELSWNAQQPVSAVAITPTSSASTPTEVAITPQGGKTVVRKLPARGGVVRFPEAVTDSVKLQFLASRGYLGVTPDFGVGVPVSVGLRAVSVLGLRTTRDPGPDLRARFSLPCGQGPKVDVDGWTFETTVIGSVGDLVDLKPVALGVCAPLTLTRGMNNFSTADTGSEFLVTSLVMQPEHPSSLAAAATASRRTVSVVQWSAESRTLHVGAGAATYVVMAQNYNPGWVARLGNVPLRSVRVDGWQQGFLVPGGKAGTVTMVMQPDRLYQLLLVVGVALLIGLLVLALLPSRRRGAAALGAAAPKMWLLLCLGALAMLVVAGLWALVMVPLVVVARRWGQSPLAITAFSAFFAAGLFAAAHPPPLVGTGAGALEGPAQVASAIAFAAVLASLLARRTPAPGEADAAGDGLV